MKVATVEEIRRIDEQASDRYGISHEILMENAGAAVARLVLQVFGTRSISAAVVAGVGNNGGDGLVAARHLASEGADVEAFVVGEESRMSSLTQVNLERARRCGVRVQGVLGPEGLEQLREALEYADVAVDALFGVGLNRPVEGVYREAIEAVNSSGALVVSVDIPSGVNGDTGQVMGAAVRADYTVTFGLPKPGLLLYPGAELAGEVYVARISYPRELLEDPSLSIETNEPLPVPQRRPDTHKGDYGKALFVAGSRRYLGAPLFASMSFLMAGGGYSRLATVSSIVPHLASRASEVVYEGLPETPSGSLSRGGLDRILELAEWADIVVVGPGLSTDEETAQLVRDLVARVEKPVIVDGDGLTAVSRSLNVVKGRREATVLTPHLGEMSRLTGLSVDDIRRDRIGVLRRACSELGAYIVLKGAHTLIGTPDGRVFVNMTGNPGMAKAGSGDVLVGAIAAMYGLGFSVEDSVRMGVFVHGMAGDLVAVEKGVDGVTASRIMAALPRALKLLRESLEEVQSLYALAEI
ncbi:NAD(P)H-hydrate dehydratase [Infirmifilum sp. NZ]|uniref:NAD(P)H-hydrate dehydratase n=1 Tax=Infirmifilum sp. NZ TaxID=2926850 RepID=UPI0027A459DF|nr:NAD(P)H-hydrate dehydratase [Infirmifilum sp. NZ]UNQ73824.1 NAD(P)H-hydrate dehydratase [Infirmifilum sp. NZ]